MNNTYRYFKGVVKNIVPDPGCGAPVGISASSKDDTLLTIIMKRVS